MGAAAMAYTLWMKYMKYNPENPSWADRDRFLLSAGHGSMLLYSLLHLTGYDLPLSEIKRFRQWDSMTPGHPERGHTPAWKSRPGLWDKALAMPAIRFFFYLHLLRTPLLIHLVAF